MYKQENLIDELTGLYNRKGFYQATEELFARNPDITYIIAYWNVRRFKVINEVFGRDAGDAILRRMAEMIKAAYEGVEGTYGRMECDNFVVCFPKDLLDVARGFVRSGEIIYINEGTEYHYASYYGLYEVEDKSVSIESMVDRCRIAMDTVKDNYVKPYAFYTAEMRKSIVIEQMLMSQCETAIKRSEFEVYYQPVCNALDGTITSAEALVRWNHPKRGMISPGAFIPLFERNGFISILDRYVWDKVCRMQRRRIDAGKAVVPVSINVSRVDFYNQQLCEDIINILQKYDLEPELLRLEVTESSYSDNPQKVMDTVKRLQENGFTIMMDDFGSGYSSLNTLKDLPVDILKIDMKFMNDLEKGGKSAVILESVVRMAKWMSLKAVAEGVETEDELNFLKSVDCNYIQGFYFYKPMPEKEFEELLNNPELVDSKNDELKKFHGDDFEVLYDASMKSEGVFQNMVGGLGIYELVGDRLEIMRANKGYYDMLKPKDPEMMAAERLVSNYMYEEDYKMLLEKCEEAERLKDTVQTQIRRLRYDGEPIWLDMHIRFLGHNGSRKMFYFYIMDITRIKQAEMESYRNRYSKAIFKVFDKVYRLDYDTGYMEVLHSADDSMKVGEKRYFPDFFERYKEVIPDERRTEYDQMIRLKENLDTHIAQSKTGTVCIEYQVCSPESNLREISATFFKVEALDGGDEYLACIKRIYD